MDRSEISHLARAHAHADHPIAGPLSDASVPSLLRGALAGRARVLDLGCGDGSWLFRALQLHPGLTATGGVPVGGHVSSLEEWDAHEWSGTGALACC